VILQISVTKNSVAGTLGDSDVTEVGLYYDSNADGVFQSFPTNPIPDTLVSTTTLNSGVATFSPYKIKSSGVAGSRDLDLDSESSRSVAFFIEALYRRRVAWSHAPLECIRITWDTEVELGFSNASKDLAAKTIAGAGEFFGQFTWGLPLWSNATKPDKSDATFTVDAEAIVGITTDLSALAIHAYYGIGPSFTWEIPLLKAANGKPARPVELLLGFYAGGVGVPDFMNSDSTSIKVARDLPRYREAFAEFARTELRVPVADTTMVCIDGLFAEDHTKAKKSLHPWSATIGLTLPLEKLVGLLKLE
jgi:hypothetical protein